MHSMSGANNPAAGFIPLGVQHGDDDDAGCAFFHSQARGAAGLTPSYSSITDYLQGFLDPAGLARHFDAPTAGDAVSRGSVAGDAVIISDAAAPSVATPNTSTSSEPRRGKNSWLAPEEEGDEQGEVDDEGSAPDHRNSRGDAKKKKGKVEKKARGTRVAFATKSEVDHLDDGYRWRKYGQKAVKNSSFPRSYYRCTAAQCGVKKQVERSQQDPSTVFTTYEGQHAHPSPTTHRGIMDTGLYHPLASIQQQRHGFYSASSPNNLLLAARAMAPPATAALPAVLLPRQAEHYGMQLQDVLLDPLAGNQHVHR